MLSERVQMIKVITDGCQEKLLDTWFVADITTINIIGVVANSALLLDIAAGKEILVGLIGGYTAPKPLYQATAGMSSQNGVKVDVNSVKKYLIVSN